jgi:cysteine-S-conjugate beta-lyase
MSYNFDQILDRRRTNSTKWGQIPEDVIPLSLADMDFRTPEPVLDALRSSLEFGVLGYDLEIKTLQEVASARLERLYGWKVTPEMVIATPGIVSGFNTAARTVCGQGDGILIQVPVYNPFQSVSENADLTSQTAPLILNKSGQNLVYDVDFSVFKSSIHSNAARTHMFLLCNPHNPTGNMFSVEELIEFAELCLENNVIICSDEIHSELILSDRHHIPIASISPEIANHTITLISPSKTFNVPGLFCGLAIIPDPNLRERFKKQAERLTLHVNSLGIVSAQAALSGECDDWLMEIRSYLRTNRDILLQFIQDFLPGIHTTNPEATYLAWLDCNDLISEGKIQGSPYEFFLKEAKIDFNDGKIFGPGGEGFVRLNFGCPRSTLMIALERMRNTLYGK